MRRSRFKFIRSSINKGSQIRSEDAHPFKLSDHKELAHRIYSAELIIKAHNKKHENNQLILNPKYNN
ncbi:hypothetical protein YerA41_014 [Yersinia phage YerA41]|nr:hypothetical protein YerA41_014 [Yersinia phage YerA41]